jgi:hypothetical protein
MHSRKIHAQAFCTPLKTGTVVAVILSDLDRDFLIDLYKVWFKRRRPISCADWCHLRGVEDGGSRTLTNGLRSKRLIEVNEPLALTFISAIGIQLVEGFEGPEELRISIARQKAVRRVIFETARQEIGLDRWDRAVPIGYAMADGNFDYTEFELNASVLITQGFLVMHGRSYSLTRRGIQEANRILGE